MGNDAIKNKDTQILKDDKLDETNKFEIEKSDLTEKDTQMDSVENSVSLRKLSNVENSDMHRSESKTHELNNQNFTENNDAIKNKDTQILKDDKLDDANKFEHNDAKNKEKKKYKRGFKIILPQKKKKKKKKRGFKIIFPGKKKKKKKKS